MMKNRNSAPLMGSIKYEEGLDFRKVLNGSLNVFFKDAWRAALTNPPQAYHFMKTVKWQKKAANIRSSWKEKGVLVPPMMIFSVTNQCKLHCKGCYNRAMRTSDKPEMDPAKIHDLIKEAAELGISFVMIAGGEPLVRPEIFDIINNFPQTTFLVFTNGLLIDDKIIEKLSRLRNVVPVISLEGYEDDTDERRGEGVFKTVWDTLSKLKDRGIFWSVSMTVTRKNAATVSDGLFVKNLFELGCKLFFFVEYTPVSEDSKDLLITGEQRSQLLSVRDSLRRQYPALFIEIPGDEDEIGGCLSAGRGFIHVNAAGDVEPCPFAPYSDTNLRDMSLKEALQSEFLEKIRENHGRLNDAEGGCALWIQREWIKTLLNNPGTVNGQ
jgi:MoaA/NifB/PqqE/SkfB family radical SAM enzyme